MTDLPGGFSLDPPPGFVPDAPPGVAPPIAQNDAWWRKPAILGSSVVKGFSDLMEGLSTAGRGGQASYEDPMFSLGRQMVDPTYQPQFPPQQNQPGAAPGIPEALRTSGIIDRPDLKPQTPTERYIAAGGEGVGSAVPLALATGGASLPSAIAQSFFGGVGGEVGRDVFPSRPGLAGTLGGFAGGVAGGGLYSAAGRGINQLRGITSPAVKAYDALGIPTSLAGDVTGNPTLQKIQATSADLPMGGPVRTAAKETIDKFGNAVEGTASFMAPAKTIQEAGTALQSDARTWLDNWNKASTLAWNKVGMYVPRTMPVAIGNTQAVVTKLASEMADAPELAKALNNTKFDQIKAALDSSATRAGTLSYGTMKSFLSDIGERIGDPGIAADIPTGKLKALYGAILDDIKGAVPAGPATDAFNTARDITRAGHGFVENYVSKIIGSAKVPIDPEKAASFAMGTAGNGGSRLTALRAGGLDQGVDNLAAWKLRDMALATAGKQGAAGEKVSPGTFLTEINKLSPEAHDALFNKPWVQDRLANLRVAADAMRQTTENVNVSRTGPFLTTKELLSVPRNMAEGAAGGYYLGGIPGAGIGAVAGSVAPFAPGFIGSRLTATPWLSRYMATPAPYTGGARMGGAVGMLSNLPQVLKP